MHSYLGISYLMKRALLMGFGFLAFILFLADITWDDGIGDFHDLAVPLIVGVLVNVSLPKIGRENLITPLGLIMLFLFIGTEQGTTLHTFMMGGSMGILLLNAIRPWNV